MSRPARAARLIEMELNLGALQHGVEQGPAAVRAAVRERVSARAHDPELDILRAAEVVRITAPDRLAVMHELDAGHHSPGYLRAVADACTRLADAVEASARERLPFVVVGGDHAMAMGTVAGLRRVYRRVGVLYVDAHADLNVWSESPSKHAHGMAASTIIGRPGVPDELLAIGPARPMIQPEWLVQLALRDLDWGEKQFLRRTPEIVVRTVLDVERSGITAIAEEVIAHFERQDLDGIHVSLDIDALDPGAAPGTGLPVEGGLTEREIEVLLIELRRNMWRVPVLSLEIAEVNPIPDTRNRTAALAAKLICRFLGEEIAREVSLPSRPPLELVS